MLPTSPKKNNKRRRLNWKRAGLILGVLVLAAVTFLGSSVWVFLNGIQEVNGPDGEDPDDVAANWTREPKPHERMNILFLGVDAPQVLPNGTYVPRRSDTIMVVSIDPLTHEIGILSIPRDTRVHMGTYKKYKTEPSDEKINAAHAHGGPNFAMQTVEEFLDVPIHYYVRLDFEGAERVIDILGGVEINVQQDMDYEDPTQDLYIHIKKGPQFLSGSDALGYVRYRQDGDIQRIERQQKFLKAMLEKMLNVGTILKLPQLASEAANYVDTNMPKDKMLELARFGMGMSSEDLTTETVPGAPEWIREPIGKVSYWIADEEALQDVINRVVRGIDPEYNSTLTVKVLNATTINGAAAELAGILEEQGFNVVEVANAEKQNNPQTTKIVNSYEEVLPGQLAARSVLHVIPGAELFHAPEEAKGEEESGPSITVIIGLDFPEEIRTGRR